MTERPKLRFSWVRKLMKRSSSNIASNGTTYASGGKRQGHETTDNNGIGANGTANSDFSAGSSSVINTSPTDSHTDSQAGYSFSRRSGASSASVNSGTEELPEPLVSSSTVISDAKSPSINTGTALSRNRSIGADSYLSTETNSSSYRPSRVQIVDSRPHAKSDTDSVLSQRPSIGSNKRKSNSNFTVPSIAETSATTVSPPLSDTASTNTAHTVPPVIATIPATASGAVSLMHVQTLNMDTASVITIASSSKRHGRRSSFDTNSSMLALAPESIISRTGSIESYPTAPAKSISSSYKFSDED